MCERAAQANTGQENLKPRGLDQAQQVQVRLRLYMFLLQRLFLFNTINMIKKKPELTSCVIFNPLSAYIHLH